MVLTVSFPLIDKFRLERIPTQKIFGSDFSEVGLEIHLM